MVKYNPTEKIITMIILNKKNGVMSYQNHFKHWYMKNRSGGDVGVWYVHLKSDTK